MTEAFAATVAAVAPVIWLVGSVELHQIHKRTAEQAAVRAQGIAAARLFLDSLGETPSLAKIDEFYERLYSVFPGDPRDPRLSRTTLVAPAVWGVIVAWLVGAEVLALLWLSEPEAKPAAPIAWFCFLALIVGFAGVSYFPLAVSFIRWRKATREPQDDLKEIKARMDAIHERLRTRMADIRAALDQEQTAEGVAELHRQLQILGGEVESAGLGEESST